MYVRYMICLSINVYHFWIHQQQLALQYTKIKRLEKLWSCIADDQYYHSSSAYMSGGRNQKGERPFPNTSVVPMTCQGKDSNNQDLWSFMKFFAPNFQQWIFPFCQTNDGQGNNFCLSKYSPLRVYVHFKQRYSKAGILTSLKAHASLLSLTVSHPEIHITKTIQNPQPESATSHYFSWSQWSTQAAELWRPKSWCWQWSGGFSSVSWNSLAFKVHQI